MITVLRAPGLLTVQDLGRPGFLGAGVPVGGAMDAGALAHANRLVGNPPGAAALEWCLGGGTLRFETNARFAIAGATLAAHIGGRPVESGVAQAVLAGDVLEVDRVAGGMFAYVSVAGGIDVPLVLGSRATYLPARLGGLEGRQLRAGDRLTHGPAPAAGPRTQPPPEDPIDAGAPVPLVRLPDPDALDDAGWRLFLDTTWRVSAAVSRMGYRLEGTGPAPRRAADRLSAPTVAGAVQLPPNGQPVVLMADAPTIGGYPTVGVVPRYALGRVAQRAPGSPLRFEEAAAAAAREARAAWERRLDGITSSHGSAR